MRHLRVLCFSLLTSSVLAFGQNTQSLEAQQQTKTAFFIERIEICCLDAYDLQPCDASPLPDGRAWVPEKGALS